MKTRCCKKCKYFKEYNEESSYLTNQKQYFCHFEYLGVNVMRSTNHLCERSIEFLYCDNYEKNNLIKSKEKQYIHEIWVSNNLMPNIKYKQIIKTSLEWEEFIKYNGSYMIEKIKINQEVDD